VTAEVASILDRLAEAARQAQKRYADVFDPASPDLRLVSALAEGADRIAAKAALEAGWTLEAVLPLAREEYEQDFDSLVSKEAFRSLLGQASNVFCLTMPPAAAARPRAYEAAGHLTLDNCDILLTVWDGKPGRGRGGTPEIIADALERGVPVLHVHAAANTPPSLLRGERKPEELRADMGGLVESLVAPPGDHSGLDRFLSEAEPDGAARDGRILGWWRFTGWFAAFARAFGGKPHGAGPPPRVEAGRNEMGPGEAMLHSRYATADAISTHLGNVYRSAFTLVFLASAFAVLAGLAGVFWWHDPVVKASFVVLELGFIGVVLRLTQIGRKRAWHRRWLETRRLAELLRVATALAPAGGGPPIAPNNELDAEGAWTEWYARSSLREVHVPSATADSDYLRRTADGFVADLIDGQIRYHSENTKRLFALHHGLDWIGMKLFWATFGIGLAFVVSVASVKAVQWVGVVDFEHGRFHEEFHRLHEIFEDWVKPAVMLCSAGFPALGAALYGIRAQGDYDASASRSEATARALVAVRGRIVEAGRNPDFVVLRGLFVEAAEIMQSDLSDWRQIYRHRPITIPA
jgi:hypothetical protein